jgi:transposase
MLFGLEQLREDIARKRRRWRALQPHLDANQLVFVDETWIKTNMAPLRGWGPRCERLKGYAPHGHWRTLTFVGALRASGMVAPCVFDGPINGEAFSAWIAQALVPVLRPGDIVVMDNLGSHKGKEVRRRIRAAGARIWFLPAYSPDLNPIEQAFSKIKHAMRMAQQRTVEAVLDAAGAIVKAITTNESRNYIAAAGYGSVKT